MQYSVVNFNKVLSDSDSLRYDADFFRADYLQLESAIKKNTFATIGDTGTKIRHPKEIKRIYEDSGVFFLRAQNVRPLLIDLESNPVYISEIDAARLSSNKIENEDILITRTGANFGQCAIFLEDTKVIASSHTFIVKTRNINPFYLTIFLNSKYGRALLDKGMYGAVQPEIAPYFIYNIPVPKLEVLPDLIKSAYIQSQDFLNTSTDKIKYAEELLLDKLNLHELPGNPLSYVKSFSNIANQERLDAEYFQPGFDSIENKIKQDQSSPLGEVAKFKKGKQRTDSHYEKLHDDIPYCSIKDIEKLSITPDQFLSKKSVSKNLTAARNDLLLAITGATIGKIGINLDEDELAYSGDVLRIRTNGINPLYLAIFLHSSIGQSLILRYPTGTTNRHLSENDVAKVLIPRLGDIETEIAEHVLESQKFKSKSLHIKHLCIRSVEEAIEFGENRATNSLREELAQLGIQV